MKEVVRHSYKDGEISETRTLGFFPFSYEPAMIRAISNIIAQQLLQIFSLKSTEKKM
jgi:hypothetical protein